MNTSPRDRRRTLSATKLVRGDAGFTLLEVILAIAILAIALAAIGEVVRLALRNASDASDQLEARLVAQSVMAELKSGAREMMDVGPEQLDSQSALGEWSVQVLIEPTLTDELLQVRVLVDRELVPDQRPACELVRWFANPEYAPAPTTAGI